MQENESMRRGRAHNKRLFRATRARPTHDRESDGSERAIQLRDRVRRLAHAHA